MKTRWMRMTAGLMLAVWMASGIQAFAQEAAPAPAAAGSGEITLEQAKAEAEKGGGNDFISVVISSGPLGIALWLSLLLTSMAGVYLCIDAFVKIRESRIMPMELLNKVRAAMDEGDVGKALEYCKAEPTILSNILRAGFENVEEGFDVIQESINAVADLESERLLQRVTYLSVVSNLAPMLGLLGTVQGMIYAFATLATQSAGAAQQAMLASNIAQALYTTAAGLVVAVPTVAFFYFFRNRANNIILSMVILTNDLIKTLRNVEVVPE